MKFKYYTVFRDITSNKHGIAEMEGREIPLLRQPRIRDNRPAVISRRMMIVGHYMAGQGIHEISRSMGINRKTVQKWVRRYKEEGHVKTRPRCGRPRVTSPDDDRRVVEAAEQYPLKTATALAQDARMPCSVVTTRRRLKEAELYCHVPARKETLSKSTECIVYDLLISLSMNR